MSIVLAFFVHFFYNHNIIPNNSYRKSKFDFIYYSKYNKYVVNNSVKKEIIMEKQSLPVLITPFLMIEANYNENLDQCLDRLYAMKQKLNRDFYTYFNGCLITTEKSRNENLKDYHPFSSYKRLLGTHDLNKAIDLVTRTKDPHGYVEYYAATTQIETPSGKLYRIPSRIIDVDARFLEDVPEDKEREFILSRVEDSRKFGSYEFFQELNQKSEPDPDDNF